MCTYFASNFKADYCSRVVDGPKMSFGSGETMRNQVVKGGSRAVFECVVVSAPQVSHLHTFGHNLEAFLQ